MDVQNVKQEIDNHDDFLLNIDIKKDFIDEASTIKIQNTNEQINEIHSIKQEIDDDLNTNKIFDNNVDATNKTKSNISITQFILNKPGYSKAARRKGIKSNVVGLIRDGKYLQPNAMGLMICVYCGKLYTKQVELLCHITINHCIKVNNFYKMKIHHKSKSDTCIMENVDIKDEIEVIEHELKVELKDIKNQLDVTDNLNSSFSGRDNLVIGLLLVNNWLPFF
ncbi:uncharacterized protein LOC130895452 isoform X2 [Diorhabda carinulata]|uniref:uncharacterized protein LOC130895452 isoform X2 n=1 Tax=Diorhabda carinulata TaxID=1163345 RepID=UPI0025A25FA3|nr:uncharacterized protein LOC130895452 isoform X2 [Diorhabda carinulata]